MTLKITYWVFIVLVAVLLGGIYLYRNEIPITKSFEELLDVRIVIIDEQKMSMAKEIVNLQAEQNAERAFREEAKSNIYSNPYRALKIHWLKIEIALYSILKFLCIYRILFYFLAFYMILFVMHKVFWKYYAF